MDDATRLPLIAQLDRDRELVEENLTRLLQEAQRDITKVLAKLTDRHVDDTARQFHLMSASVSGRLHTPTLNATEVEQLFGQLHALDRAIALIKIA